MRAAEQRALAFAQRLWSDETIRNNTKVNKLITIKIVASLTRWFFDVLSKHLIGYKTADLRGGEALGECLVGMIIVVVMMVVTVLNLIAVVVMMVVFSKY